MALLYAMVKYYRSFNRQTSNLDLIDHEMDTVIRQYLCNKVAAVKIVRNTFYVRTTDSWCIDTLYTARCKRKRNVMYKDVRVFFTRLRGQHLTIVDVTGVDNIDAMVKMNQNSEILDLLTHETAVHMYINKKLPCLLYAMHKLSVTIEP